MREGRTLRRQLRHAVADAASSRKVTVFDVWCNREHSGSPALLA